MKKQQRKQINMRTEIEWDEEENRHHDLHIVAVCVLSSEYVYVYVDCTCTVQCA